MLYFTHAQLRRPATACQIQIIFGTHHDLDDIINFGRLHLVQFRDFLVTLGHIWRFLVVEHDSKSEKTRKLIMTTAVSARGVYLREQLEKTIPTLILSCTLSPFPFTCPSPLVFSTLLILFLSLPLFRSPLIHVLVLFPFSTGTRGITSENVLKF